jgi:hypothetical protein
MESHDREVCHNEQVERDERSSLLNWLRSPSDLGICVASDDSGFGGGTVDVSSGWNSTFSPFLKFATEFSGPQSNRFFRSCLVENSRKRLGMIEEVQFLTPSSDRKLRNRC